jgi:hypothetical protein
LYRWVAILTGSKNALKGVGFFLGGLLLSVLDFQSALKLAGGAGCRRTLILAAVLMRGGLGQANKKAKFGQMFSRNGAVNKLAAARIFLFGARDVWFVVGLPVFLSGVLGWTFWQSGGFLAAWVIGYGIVQAATPGLLRSRVEERHEPDGRTATLLAFVLAALPAGIALSLNGGVAPASSWSPADRLRRCLCAEFGGAFLPDPGLHRQRQGGDERRLLLHGERRRPSCRHRSLGRALPVGRAERTERRPDRLPLGVRGLRSGRRSAVAAPAAPGGRTQQTNQTRRSRRIALCTDHRDTVPGPFPRPVDVFERDRSPFPFLPAFRKMLIRRLPQPVPRTLILCIGVSRPRVRVAGFTPVF